MKEVIICAVFMILLGLVPAYAQENRIDPQVSVQPAKEVKYDNKVSIYKRWANYIIVTALLISLIVVIYHLAEGTGKGKKAVVSWLVALVAYIVFKNLF